MEHLKDLSKLGGHNIDLKPRIKMVCQELLIKSHREKHRSLYITFLDLEEAFDWCHMN